MEERISLDGMEKEVTPSTRIHKSIDVRMRSPNSLEDSD